jgi:hypothetical protein
MLAYFFHVTLSANQNAYSGRISAGGGGGVGISVLYNKINKYAIGNHEVLYLL